MRTYRISNREQPARGGPPAWVLGEVLTTPLQKTCHVAKHSKSKPRIWTHTQVRLKQRKRNMRFGTWNVRSVYRARSFTAAARELARC